MSAIPRSRIAEAICRFALRGLIANGSAGPHSNTPRSPRMSEKFGMSSRRAPDAEAAPFRRDNQPALPAFIDKLLAEGAAITGSR